MRNGRQKHWKIELDGQLLEDHIEDAISRSAQAVEQGLRGVKGVQVTITDDPESRAERRARRRDAKAGGPLVPVAIPPETPEERRQRVLAAILSPGALWTFGGMLIAGVINFDSSVGIGMIMGGLVFYVAMASGEFQTLEARREKRLRKLIQAGQLPVYVPDTSDIEVPQIYARQTAPIDAESPRAKMDALIARIRSRLDLDQPAVSVSELARYSELASHYETKAAEIRAYLSEIGGVDPAKTELAALRTQLEQLPPDDARQDSLKKLITIKEQTTRNLIALERFLATVEGKFQEQLAHLESLDAALMRHKLGTFARQTHAEETLSTREVEALAEGLTQTADALEQDLSRINLELA